MHYTYYSIQHNLHTFTLYVYCIQVKVSLFRGYDGRHTVCSNKKLPKFRGDKIFTVRTLGAYKNCKENGLSLHSRGMIMINLSLTLIRMTKDEKGLAFFKGLLL